MVLHVFEFGRIPGSLMAKFNARRHASVIARCQAVRQLLAEKAPVDPTAHDAQRWLAFPEVARQARRWVRSSAGLMAHDVVVLNRRLTELQVAQT